MSLDISAYSRISYDRPYSADDDAYIEGDGTEYLYSAGFTEQLDGLTPGLYRYAGDRFDFGAGSYHGYNEWRAWLCRQALKVEPETVWNDPASYREAPFFALIHFSDCESSIGPQTSRALAADFARFADQLLPVVPDPWYARVYRNFARAFTLAAEDGAVRFH